MSRVDELVREIESLTLEELKQLFDRLEDLLDLLGWIKLNEVNFC
ncbi:hypothetical protein [Desulfovirgula thermocuniculi]|nr:hypothetical protein [Desulfovirgula thermocuniculi]